jgi:molybdopterin synthase sulfur carrier subunit
VRVRLFGTLGQGLLDYQPSQGIEVEVPEGATVRDLLVLLGLSECRGAVVIAEGRVLKADSRIQHGVSVNIMQAIGGG